jgi:hypothetical protein
MSLEGRLEDLGLGDIFQIISLSKRSGVLTLIRKEGTARLVFRNGQVIFASSDSISRLGFTLVRKGLITNEDLEYALRSQQGRGPTKPLGTILIEMEAIAPEVLERELREHVVGVVRDLLKWESGSFHFELGSPGDDQIAAATGLSTEFLLLEGTRLNDEQVRETSGQSRPAAAPRRADPPPARAPARAPAESAPRPQPQPRIDMESTQVQATPPRATAPRPAPAALDSSLPSHPGYPRRDLALLTAMIAELSKPSSSSELTLMVLRFASEMMNRAIVFLVRQRDLVGLGQFGLRVGEDAQEYVKTLRIPLNEPSIFQQVVDQKTAWRGPLESGKWHQYLADKLGGQWPTEVFIAPLICESRVIALLYGDNLPADEVIGETEGLEAFIKVAGVAFGKALLERKLLDAQKPVP